MWYLLPVALDANATRNIPPYTDYWPDSPDYNVIDYAFAENPDIVGCSFFLYYLFCIGIAALSKLSLKDE